jgi:hypothetical protein
VVHVPSPHGKPDRGDQDRCTGDKNQTSACEPQETVQNQERDTHHANGKKSHSFDHLDKANPEKPHE